MQVGNAFRLLNKQGKLAGRTFDRIALSPPSESIITQEGLFPTEDKKQMGDSAFTSLLIDRLKSTGRGTVIVSDDLVTPSNVDQYNLHEQLIANQYLRAVITLASTHTTIAKLSARSSSTHILYIDKNAHTKTNFIWLCDIGGDDSIKQPYDSVPNTLQTLEEKDLLFLQRVVHITGKDSDFDEFEDDEPFRQKKFFSKNICLGIVIKVNPGAKIESIHYAWLHSTLHLFIEVQTSQHPNSIYIVKLEKNPVYSSLEQLHSISSTIDTMPLVFTNGDEGQLIAISADGRLLGTTLTFAEISSGPYNLLPRYHLRWHSDLSVQPSLSTRDRASIWMGEINELYIEEETDTLLEETPLPHISHHTSTLLQPLNVKQRAIWQLIEQNYSTDQYALHFTAEHMQRLSHQADVASTLALLEHMGLIRRVTLAGTQNQPAQQLYRRIIATEVVKTQAKDTKIEAQ